MEVEGGGRMWRVKGMRKGSVRRRGNVEGEGEGLLRMRGRGNVEGEEGIWRLKGEGECGR